MICTCLIITENTGGFFIYSLMYWEKVPKWQCKYFGDVWDDCTAAETCTLAEKGQYDMFRPNPDDQYSFYNLAT